LGIEVFDRLVQIFDSWGSVGHSVTLQALKRWEGTGIPVFSIKLGVSPLKLILFDSSGRNQARDTRKGRDREQCRLKEMGRLERKRIDSRS